MKKLFFTIVLLMIVLLTGCAAPDNAATDTTASVLSTDQNVKENAPVNHELNAEAAKSLINEKRGEQNFTVLDVRTAEERKSGCLENSVNIDFYGASFADELGKLDKSNTYLVYCRSGRRSGESVKLMESMGFENVYNMTGGVGAWQESGGELSGTC